MHIKNLLALHDEDFIFALYSAILKRSPDESGKEYYLGELRSGVSKEEIAYRIAASSEAKSKAADINDLDKLIHKWSKLKNPILRPFYSTILRGGKTEKKLRAIENSLHVYHRDIKKIAAEAFNVIENKTQNSFPCKTDSVDSEISVGIHLHAYYADLAEEFLSAIKNVKFRKHLYVSVCSAVDIDVVEEAIRLAGINFEDCTIKVVPNRGRNFGPMLVEFRKSLKKHDFILHLHTKKSLRTGVDQVEWRRNSWMSLCGSPELVNTVIDNFSKDEKLGLIGPAPKPGFSSYWWRSWLSVGHLLRDYFGRLGISSYEKKGLIAFPIGSMCWARSSALSPLMNYDWRYEDFPEEPCADDGTIAHVIERSLAVISASQGFSYKEIQAHERGYIKLSSPQMLLEDYHGLNSRFANRPTEQVLSFDFFDTLFVRYSLTPEDIQNYVGFRLKNYHKIYNGYAFLEYRKEAESVARSKVSSGEVNFDQIYDCFKEVTNWSSDIIAIAKNLELEFELKSLHPRLEVVEYAKAAKRSGTRLIVVSDIYFSSSFLGAVLKKWGLEFLFDELYVSSERLVRKDWGSMWPLVKSKEGLTDWDAKFLHIGDNEQSDVQQPIRNGVRSAGVLNPAVMYHLLGGTLPKDWKTGKSSWIEGVVIGPVVARLCNSPIIHAKADSLAINKAEDFGYAVFGPLLFGFSRWLIDQAKNSPDLKQYAFLSRDGWFLKSAYDRLCSIMPPGSFVPSVYLEVSRQSLFALSADRKSTFEKMLSSGSFKGSLREFFIERMSYDLGSKYDEKIIDLSFDVDFVWSVYQKNIKDIERHCRRNRLGFAEYVDSLRVGKNTALVDVGYGGTIQSIMQEVLDVGLIGYYFAVNKKISCVEVGFDGKAFGYYGDQRYTSHPLSVIDAYSMILEAVFSAPHGKVLGYGEGGAVVHSKNINKKHFQFCSKVMDGALNYIDDLINQYDQDLLEIPLDHEMFSRGFNDLVSGKYRLNDQLISQLVVEDDFCGNGIINVLDLYKI